MKRRFHTPVPDPFLGWATLAWQAAEMLVASTRVIHHRTSRRNNVVQLFEMGNEKVQAAIESSHAMTRHWLSMRDRTGPAPWGGQWARLLSSGVTPFHARALRNARRATRR